MNLVTWIAAATLFSNTSNVIKKIIVTEGNRAKVYFDNRVEKIDHKEVPKLICGMVGKKWDKGAKKCVK